MFEAWTQEPIQQNCFRKWKEEKISRSLKFSGVGNHFKDKKLDDLRDNERLYQECARYVQNWKEMRSNGFGFFFWGNVGAGKTHAAAALANDLMREKLVEVLFLSMPATVTRVKKTFDSPVKNEDTKLFDRMKEVELLIIDDLGVEKLSDWLSDQIYQIVDHRWQNKKPMIITSNQSLDDLGIYYKAQVISRIWGCCKSIKFTEEDRRKQTKLF
jgi:DNA replication protein DnaC